MAATAAAEPATSRVDRPPAVLGGRPERSYRRTSHASRAMGGRLDIHVVSGATTAADADRDARRAAGRVGAWARLLTRHDPASPLMRLNGDPRADVPAGPTLAAALAWAGEAGAMTGGLVDVTRLDERLAAEAGGARDGSAGAVPVRAATPRAPAWALHVAGPRQATVTRAPGTRFDLDGIGKGWLADRALRLLDRHAGAAVDADGDVAVHVAPGDRWEIGVADPRRPDELLAVIVLADEPGAAARGWRAWGVATSGTSVHRFGPDAHHLIDPRTGRPAATDVVQATVLASGAAVAEAFAKGAVILGSAAGLDFLDRARVAGAILLLEDGRVLALPRTLELLA